MPGLARPRPPPDGRRAADGLRVVTRVERGPDCGAHTGRCLARAPRDLRFPSDWDTADGAAGLLLSPRSSSPAPRFRCVRCRSDRRRPGRRSEGPGGEVVEQAQVVLLMLPPRMAIGGRPKHLERSFYPSERNEGVVVARGRRSAAVTAGVDETLAGG